MRSFFKAPPQPTHMQLLEQQLNETQRELARAYGQFNYVSDPELVEACVYEIKALQTKSSFLLRCIKQMESGAPGGEDVLWA